MAPPIPATARPAIGLTAPTVAPSAIAPRISSGAYWLAAARPIPIPIRAMPLLLNFCIFWPKRDSLLSNRAFILRRLNSLTFLPYGVPAPV